MQKTEEQKPNEFKGYPLFNQIQEDELRCHNRANTMLNIYEAVGLGLKVPSDGAALMFAYFAQLPAKDRPATYERFKQVLAARGYLLKEENRLVS